MIRIIFPKGIPLRSSKTPIKGPVGALGGAMASGVAAEAVIMRFDPGDKERRVGGAQQSLDRAGTSSLLAICRSERTSKAR